MLRGISPHSMVFFMRMKTGTLTKDHQICCNNARNAAELTTLLMLYK